MIGTRQRLLLGALIAAGDEGVPGNTLALLAGHRYPEYLRRLRAAGVAIEAKPQHGSRFGSFTFRLARPAPAALASQAVIPSLPSPAPRLSARQGYLRIRRALQVGSIDAYAELAELLRAQPELAQASFVRHNLGAAKCAALDALVRDSGIPVEERRS